MELLDVSSTLHELASEGGRERGIIFGLNSDVKSQLHCSQQRHRWYSSCDLAKLMSGRPHIRMRATGQTSHIRYVTAMRVLAPTYRVHVCCTHVQAPTYCVHVCCTHIQSPTYSHAGGTGYGSAVRHNTRSVASINVTLSLFRRHQMLIVLPATCQRQMTAMCQRQMTYGTSKYSVPFGCPGRRDAGASWFMRVLRTALHARIMRDLASHSFRSPMSRAEV